jgi:hypothetical protein
MILPRSPEENLITADQLTAELVAKVSANPWERINWPYHPFTMRDFPFSEILSTKSPISDLLEPKLNPWQQRPGESEEIKALGRVLAVNTSTLFALSPQELKMQFGRQDGLTIASGVIVYADQNSFILRAGTKLKQGNTDKKNRLHYYLLIKDTGHEGISVAQFLSNSRIENVIKKRNVSKSSPVL